MRRLDRALARRRRAEHDDDQSPPALRRARHDVEPGRTGEAGLHAVGAGIAADAGRCGWDDLVAQLQRADVEEIAVLGKFLEQRAPDHRHVARRRDVRGIMQAVRIDEMRFLERRAPAPSRSSRRRRPRPSRRRPSATITATSLGDLTISIFRALSSVTSTPGRKPIFEAGMFAARADIVSGVSSVNAPVAHRLQRDIGRHQLGQRGRIPGLGRVALEQRLAAVDVDDQRGRRRRSARAERQRASENRGAQPICRTRSQRHRSEHLRASRARSRERARARPLVVKNNARNLKPRDLALHRT